MSEANLLEEFLLECERERGQPNFFRQPENGKRFCTLSRSERLKRIRETEQLFAEVLYRRLPPGVADQVAETIGKAWAEWAK